MTGLSASSNALAVASRFLNAFNDLNTILAAHNVSGVGDLNATQIRILQLVNGEPGIRADAVIERLDITKAIAGKLILAMEKTGLLELERSTPDVPPAMRLGEQGTRLVYQIRATQLSILVEMLGYLPEEQQYIAVDFLEQLAKHKPE